MTKFKNIFLSLSLLFLATLSFAQIKGRITTAEGAPIRSASISIQNTYNATSTNANGEFELKVANLESCILICQSLGYITKKVEWNKTNSNKSLTIILESKTLDIEEVIVTLNHNPADRIIKNAIANRAKNEKIMDKYEADFYSKGSMTLLKVPNKILGIKIDSNEVGLTKESNILYLSETISQIKVQKPNKMSEKIIASKVSGDNKGLSFNRADGSDFELYSNYIDFNGINIVSPIADHAFSYYKYQLISTSDEDDQIIYKIKIIPKRDGEPVFGGYIYIADDSWQIYATDIYTLGSRVNFAIMDTLQIRQQYTFHQKDNRWVKQLQLLDIKAGVLGINFKGNFTQTFNNYNFNPSFDKNTFTRVITEFDKEANTKNDDFWNIQRQVPLSIKEIKDYSIKDSIALVKNNPAYIDSVDHAKSKFRINDLIGGYHYQNTPRKLSFDYLSPLSLQRVSFNTVQGWNLKAALQAKLGEFSHGQLTQASVQFNYGFEDNKLYTTGRLFHRFNKTNYAQLTLSGGNKVQQFNPDEPISPFINMISSLFFKHNYMKLYGTKFITANYSQYVHPNIKVRANLSYQNRSNLYNNTSYSFFRKDKEYTANNPLDPFLPETDAFLTNDILKAKIAIDIFFKTKIEKLPNEIIYLHNTSYPQLTINYTNGLYSSIQNYKYQEISTTIKQDVSFGNKGRLGYKVNAGTFLQGNDISFIDRKHFNGNRTHIAANDSYLNSYLLLPYYSYSTNKTYLEVHSAYNFQGYLLNKIPAINTLKWNTNVGYNLLSTGNRKPYHEFTAGFGNIGWGKYRFLRIDYVRTLNGNSNPNGIVVGLSLLNMFQ